MSKADAIGESTPVKALLIAIALIFLAVLLVLPLGIVFAEALRKGVTFYMQSLIDPEALQAAKRLVEPFESVVVEAADLVDGFEVAVIEFVNDLGNFLTLGGKPDAHRPAIGA